MLLNQGLIMISEIDRNTIIQMARRYGARRVLLFGSSLNSDREARDIDIAVDGVSPEMFFKFYGDLIFNISKPVDVVDLSQPGEFTSLIRQEGISLYG
jgi:predicted nucleotidyltransferase